MYLKSWEHAENLRKSMWSTEKPSKKMTENPRTFFVKNKSANGGNLTQVSNAVE